MSPATFHKFSNDLNPTCQHREVDPQTYRCVACRERMVGCTVTPKTVKSAPNLAHGSGVYIPDVRNTRYVEIGTNYAFACKRCVLGPDNVVDGDGIHWSCGQNHSAYELTDGTGV